MSETKGDIIRDIKIAIIAHCCRTGGGLFGTLNLLKAMKNVVENERFLLICSAGYGFEDIELPANSESYVYADSHSPFARYWFEKYKLPKIVIDYNPDVIFGAANVGLSSVSSPQAIFVRQAYLFYDKTYYPQIPLKLQLRIAALKVQIKKALPNTDLILCQTDVVKQRFSEKYQYPEDKVKILRLPPPVEIRPESGLQTPSVIKRSSESFYVLVLTRYMPHRNPRLLIPICQKYAEQIRAKKIKFITTVETSHGFHARKFLRQIHENGFEDIIINVGDISRQELPAYYFFSDILWLPTTLETLGLAFLEAMTMGVPILAPDIDFAHYVCGNAAIFYNPWKYDSIFEKIVMLRDKSALREDLVKQGKSQLCDRSRFAEDWEEVAADLIQHLRFLAKR